MQEKQQCSEFIIAPGMAFGHYRQCRKRGKVEIDGKWYCTIHSPEGKEKRKVAKDKRWEERQPYERLLHIAGLKIKQRRREERKQKRKEKYSVR